MYLFGMLRPVYMTENVWRDWDLKGTHKTISKGFGTDKLHCVNEFFVNHADPNRHI